MKIKGKLAKAAIFIICIIAVMLLSAVIFNKLNAKYHVLSSEDKLILSEIDKYCKANSESEIWPEFKLHEKTILAVDGRFGKAFLINPKRAVHNVFAQQIVMPEKYSINVYRVSALAPQLIKFKTIESFNQYDKVYNCFGNELYFIRYDEDATNLKPCNSGHYITFLSHESFHYYAQRNWYGGGRFSTDSLTGQALDMLGEQYAVLTQIQFELDKPQPNREDLINYSKEYVDIVKKRIAINPEYMQNELEAETAEGSATYVGIRSSEIVGYDFGVMKFCKNGKDVEEVPFDAIVEGIKSGKIDRSLITTDVVYDSGALLCLLMDELEVPEWKDQLNEQTKGEPVTLYTLLLNYLNENN